MTGLSASEKIARFVIGFDPASLGAASRHVIARALYDTLVCGIAGAGEPPTLKMLAYARVHGAGQGATLWAGGEKLAVEHAALVNGTMGHALDYDDVTSPLRGHPSVAMLPALLALGEQRGAGLRQVVDAYAVGFEVTLKLARGMVDDHYAKGWHSTASIASFGAAAACAHLLGLDLQKTTHAIGIAVSQISGTRQNFGTMSKAFQAGLANATGLRSALLAEVGFDASRVALDGEHGYTVLYADGQDIHAQLDTLGALPLEIERSGIEVKKYPLCYATHRTIDGVLDAMAANRFTFGDVERVEVVTNFRATVPLIYHRPQTGLEAKFSLEYAVTAALHDGAVRLASFDDAAVQRPAVQAFLPKVTFSEGRPPMFPRWAELAIHLHNGHVLNSRIEKLRGSKEYPLSDAELVAKGEDCCAFGHSRVSAPALAELCFAIDTLPIARLVQGLS
jgi:2-methylcitrate dehydratase PrpD